MDRYNVELASPAVKAYQNMLSFTAGEDAAKSNQIVVLDRLIDETIAFDPYSGMRLTGLLDGVFWRSEQSAHLLYDIYPDIHTVVILYILYGNEILEAAREAELAFARMCVSGKLKILPRGNGLRVA